ncbi:uncharacterized protein BJ171DRAFT_603000 [Polychytrium aggregatum]|uniref:uncharacterized protein n=1 Tax=Polychytrium aggregatum TaxID=110093 RepID=UPI0022FF22C1|nr:uncharacterized protein BJ171DRAFT_603000 [Polychytrium aggregatum]KAI9193701.1 hypothetical protein BJ171DRAFT_603000 [Polychytrium aggregatum]
MSSRSQSFTAPSPAAVLAATKIQACFRGFRVRRLLQKQAVAATKIQSVVRMLLTRRSTLRFMSRRRCVLESHSRLLQTRERTRRREQELQRILHTEPGKLAGADERLRHRAAIRIQSWLRGCWARARVHELRRRFPAGRDPRRAGADMRSSPTLTADCLSDHEDPAAGLWEHTVQLEVVQKLILDRLHKARAASATARSSGDLLVHGTERGIHERLLYANRLLDDYYSPKRLPHFADGGGFQRPGGMYDLSHGVYSSRKTIQRMHDWMEEVDGWLDDPTEAVRQLHIEPRHRLLVRQCHNAALRDAKKPWWEHLDQANQSFQDDADLDDWIRWNWVECRLDGDDRDDRDDRVDLLAFQ